MGAAAVKVTDDVNKAKVDDLRTDTTGDITLTSITEDKGNLATINGFSDVILSTANISVTDSVNKSEADTIDAYSNTSGTVTLSRLIDTVDNITAVERITSENPAMVAKSALSSVIDVRVILPVVSVLRSLTLVKLTVSVTLTAAASISTSAVSIALINWILL